VNSVSNRAISNLAAICEAFGCRPSEIAGIENDFAALLFDMMALGELREIQYREMRRR